MRPKVSVVIPVYNSAKYLEQCLDSVLGQTLRDIEVICVDDGSTDLSCEILEKYARDDERFRFLKQEHLFAGVARNKGLLEAQGEYVAFLDSDDFFHHEMLGKMYARALETEADIVICGGQKYNTVTRKSTLSPGWLQSDIIGEKTVFNRDDIPDEILNLTTAAPWNKLFLRDFIIREHILFQDIHNSNDVFFTGIAMCLASRIALVDFPYVNYRVGGRQNLQSSRAKAPLCLLSAIEALYDELQRRGLFDFLEKSFVRFVLEHISYHLRTFPDSDIKFAICAALTESHFTRMGVMAHPEEYYDGMPAWHVVCGAITALALHKQSVMRLDEARPCIQLEDKLKNGSEWEPILSVCAVIENDCNEKFWHGLERALAVCGGKIELIIICHENVKMGRERLLALLRNSVQVSIYRTLTRDYAAIRNVAAKKVLGQYIVFINDTNLLPPGLFAAILPFLARGNAEVLLCGINLGEDGPELAEQRACHFLDLVAQERKDMTGADCLRLLSTADLGVDALSLTVLKGDFLRCADIRFHSENLWVDEAFNGCVLIAALNVQFLPQQDFVFSRYGQLAFEENNIRSVVGEFQKIYYGMIQYEQNRATVANQPFISSYFKKCLKLARKWYFRLPSSEKYAWWGLPRAEASAFKMLVVDYCDLHGSLKAERNNSKSMQKALERAEKRIEKAEKRIEKDEEFIKTAEKRLQKANAQLARMETRIKNIKESRTYKIGRAIVYIPRKIMNLFHHSTQ